MTERQITQTAPWPDELEALVKAWSGRDDYSLELNPFFMRGQGCDGTTLIIRRIGPDSYHPERTLSVMHLFPVPAAAYDRRSWQRWLFDRIRDVSLHEEMENFQIDGQRPYAPSHGPGNDPYLIREVGTDLDQRTSFRGEVNP